MQDDIREILFNEQIICEKVREIAARISRDYEGKELVLVCVLKGRELRKHESTRGTSQEADKMQTPASAGCGECALRAGRSPGTPHGITSTFTRSRPRNTCTWTPSACRVSARSTLESPTSRLCTRS